MSHPPVESADAVMTHTSGPTASKYVGGDAALTAFTAKKRRFVSLLDFHPVTGARGVSSEDPVVLQWMTTQMTTVDYRSVIDALGSLRTGTRSRRRLRRTATRARSCCC